MEQYSEYIVWGIILFLVLWLYHNKKLKRSSTCIYGEPLPFFSRSFQISVLPTFPSPEEIATIETYCKEHFLEEVEKKFKNLSPIIFVKPSPSDDGSLSAFFTHDEWWEKNGFPESDWVVIQSLLHTMLGRNKNILWSEGKDIGFFFGKDGSFFKTENPELTPIDSIELKRKLDTILSSLGGNYTLQLPRDRDTGILVTP